MTITPYTIRPNKLDQYHQNILRQGLTNQRFPEHEFNQLTQEMRDHLSRDRCLPASAGQMTTSSAPSMAMKILTSLCRIIDKSQLPGGPARAVPGLSHHGKPTPEETTQDIHPALRNSPVLQLSRCALLTELNQGQTRSTTLSAELKPGPAGKDTQVNRARHHESIAAGERDRIIDPISNAHPGRGPPCILTSRNVESQRYDWSKHNPEAPDDDINVWKMADLTADMKSESDLSWEPCTQYSDSPSETIPPFFLSVDSVVFDDDGEPIAYGKRQESTIHGADEDSVNHSDQVSLVGGHEHETVLFDDDDDEEEGESDPEDVACREDELADCRDAGEGTLKGEEAGGVDEGWDTSSESSVASTVHPSSSISVTGSEYGSGPDDDGVVDAHDGPKPGVGGGGGRPGPLRRKKKLRISQLSRPLDPPDLLFSGPNLPPPPPPPPRIGFASHPPLSRSAYRGGRNHCAGCGARGCGQCVETTTSTPYFPYEASHAPSARPGEARRNSLKSKYFT